jgi:hypothetical protein
MGTRAGVQLFVDDAVAIVVAVVARFGSIGVDAPQPILAIVATMKAAGVNPVANACIDVAVAIAIGVAERFRVAVFIMHDEVRDLSRSRISSPVNVCAIVTPCRQRIVTISVIVGVDDANGGFAGDRSAAGQSMPARLQRPPNAHLRNAGGDAADNVAPNFRVAPNPSLAAVPIDPAGADLEFVQPDHLDPAHSAGKRRNASAVKGVDGQTELHLFSRSILVNNDGQQMPAGYRDTRPVVVDHPAFRGHNTFYLGLPYGIAGAR